MLKNGERDWRKMLGRLRKGVAGARQVRAADLQQVLEEGRQRRATKEQEQEKALPRSTKRNGRFVLDKKWFPTFVEQKDFASMLKWRWRVAGKAEEVQSQEELDEILPVATPDERVLQEPRAGGSQFTWLGHASCLMQWNGWNVLCDPYFQKGARLSNGLVQNDIAPRRSRSMDFPMSMPL